MCSQKWASPGRSSGSEKAPTLTSTAADAVTAVSSETSITLSPLSSVTPR